MHIIISILKTLIGLVTVILGIIAFIPYLKDTITKKTRPHIYTWFAWGLISLTAFSLQMSDGAGAGAWVTLTAAVMAFLIFLLGLKNGKRDITRKDTLFFVFALIAICLWVIAKQPVASTIFLVSGGLLSFFPTLRKSWNEPYTETASTYAINALRHLLSFFALSNYNLVTWFFPVAWGLTNTFFVIILIIRRRYIDSK